ncbi:MAG: PAS domain-containing protein, partial [Bosea sp. (in: a-proteobacteria)]
EPIGPVFRLAGTRLCALMGGELRGRAFTALWPDVEAQGEIRRLVQTVMDDTAGAVAGLSAETESGHPIYLELLLLPLRYRGRTHERILGALSPTGAPEWLGLDRIESMRMISLRMLWPAPPVQRSAAPPRAAPRFLVLPGGRA